MEGLLGCRYCRDEAEGTRPPAGSQERADRTRTKGRLSQRLDQSFFVFDFFWGFCVGQPGASRWVLRSLFERIHWEVIGAAVDACHLM